MALWIWRAGVERGRWQERSSWQGCECALRDGLGACAPSGPVLAEGDGAGAGARGWRVRHARHVAGRIGRSRS
jgi:hypothetical protein